jgi:hypothetical protein
LVQETNLEANLNRFWEAEAAEISNMTPEQEACEHHFATHTVQPSNKIEDLLSDFQ